MLKALSPCVQGRPDVSERFNGVAPAVTPAGSRRCDAGWAQNLTPPQNRISQLNYLSYRIDESENWAELRKTFFYAVHNITNNDDNLKKYLAQKLGPCFKHARSGFYNSWHLKKCRDIPDAVWSGFCLAPDLPFRAASWPTTKNDRNQKIYLRIWPRQECREYTQSHY